MSGLLSKMWSSSSSPPSRGATKITYSLSDLNTVNMVKGLCLTHLQRQFHSFEVYVAEMEALQDRLPVIMPEYWQRTLDVPFNNIKQQIANMVDRTATEATTRIEGLPEGQHGLAMQIWDAGFALACGFVDNHIANAIGKIMRAIQNHSAPNWLVILGIRASVTKHYAGAVSRIVEIPPNVDHELAQMHTASSKQDSFRPRAGSTVQSTYNTTIPGANQHQHQYQHQSPPVPGRPHTDIPSGFVA